MTFGWIFRPVSVAGVLLVAISFVAGCNDSGPTAGDQRGPIQSEARGGLFESVAQNLDRFEDFETGQILKQTTDRLNQWMVQDRPTAAWSADPLLADLPADLKNQADLRRIDSDRFQDPDDGWFLQEAVWLRNISNVARANQFDDVEVARRLFDWTVRNIRLQPDTDGIPHRPFETLLLGRGTAAERAWVFILLARQQGLDVVYLGLADPQGEHVRPWLPALVSGDQLYLFDTSLGLPLPGPKPGSIATLAELIADPQLLRKLDLDSDHPYPVTSDDLKHVVAYVEGAPNALSRRMAIVESRLSGDQKLKLTSPGAALAERVSKLPGITRAELWPFPFQVSLAISQRDEKAQNAALKETVLYQAMPALKKARALHFKGMYDGATGAKTQYLNSRPPDDYIANYALAPDVAEQYLKQGYSPQAIAKLEAAQSLMMRDAKQAASYWIGLIFFEQGDFPNAIDYFLNRTLGTKQETPWADAARYNLGRAYEASGDLPKAIELYESDTNGPQSYGNRLRAKWLKAEETSEVSETANSQEQKQEADTAGPLEGDSPAGTADEGSPQGE